MSNFIKGELAVLKEKEAKRKRIVRILLANVAAFCLVSLIIYMQNRDIKQGIADEEHAAYVKAHDIEVNGTYYRGVK
jgi:hypothetical protein